jgi:hypothetical protein
MNARNANWSYLLLLSALVFLFATGCGHQQPNASPLAVVHEHKDQPPHGGTLVALGHEEYQLELVLDAPAGKLQAYVFDGELENFVRVAAETFDVTAKLPVHDAVLVFKAVPNRATGETVGDTSMFEAQADWLKTTPAFDAILKEITIRGGVYRDIAFNFPKGNDRDEVKK